MYTLEDIQEWTWKLQMPLPKNLTVRTATLS